MKHNDSTFTTEVSRVKLPDSLANGFTIIPIGDIHYGSPACDVKGFGAALANIRRRIEVERENIYVILMGDETDTASYSERKILADQKLHESTLAVLDQNAMRINKELLGYLEFLRGRVLGCVQGNHYWCFSDTAHDEGVVKGMTSTEWLAKKLGAPWLGFLSYLRVAVTDSGSRRMPFDFVLCHGKGGGGKLVGTSINGVDDLRRVFPSADVYLSGHDHQRSAVPVDALFCPPTSKSGIPVVRQRRQWLARTGSFLKAYEAGQQSYIVQRVLRPASLGTIEIKVKVTQDHGSLVPGIQVTV